MSFHHRAVSRGHDYRFPVVPSVGSAVLVALVVVNLLLIVADDFDDGLAVVDVELLIQMREMRLHGAGRNVHLFANVCAGVPKYKQLLHATTVTSVEDTAAIAGLDLTDKAFWARGLASYAKMVDEFIELAGKK